jgi:phosphatidylglycerophosphate synthase
MPPMPAPSATSDPIADRRPIAARRLAVIQGLARFLAIRRISPNFISVVGMAGGIVAGAAFAATAEIESDFAVRALFVLAAACIQLRLLCNVIDGLVAVEGNMRSPVGEIYNEAPDRISDICTIIGAGYALSGWPTMGYWAAIFAIGTAYTRALGKGAGLGSDFRGPIAKQQRMAILTAGALYLALTPASWHLWVQIGDQPAIGTLGLCLALITIGSAFTCLRRLLGILRGLRARASSDGTTTS